MRVRTQSGQSLFEMVIAIAITTLVIISLVTLAGNSIRNTTFSKNKTLAGRHAQEAIEWLRSQRDSDFDTFQFNTLTPGWCLSELAFTDVGTCASGEVIAGTDFQREATFDQFTLGGKTVIAVVVRVYWDEGGNSHEVRLTTEFSDWRERT